MELNPYLVGLGTTALLLFVGHWFPWPHDLHRLAAYAYGVASILIGAGLWLWASGMRDVWVGLVFLSLVAGLATGLAYLIDEALTARRYHAELKDRLDKYGPKE